MLDFITWTADPVFFALGEFAFPGFSLGPITIPAFTMEPAVRWYGLMWAIGFLLGYHIISKVYENEGISSDKTETLFLCMLFGTVLGARIGHCFFYDFDYFSKHLNEVFYVWNGGLSSHGGACGILLVLWIFSKKVVKRSFLWVMDRIVLPVAICGACIRFGNLMNHEIYGHATDVPWAFEFITNIHAWQNGAEPIFSLPSHPTQIYEMLYCLVTFAVVMYLYWKTNVKEVEGFIFGVFLIGVFLTRFLLEFIKNNQEAFEETMLFNMGQILSLPLIIWGIWLVYRSIPRLKEINNQVSC